jgi:hypothetical protein
MRVIEEKMNAAIAKKQNFTLDNTTVSYNESENVSSILLHGNNIADYWHGSGLRVNSQTLKRWPTNTTKSRLRALGANLFTKKGTIYLNGQAI